MQAETISMVSRRLTVADRAADAHDVSGCAPARDILARIGDKWSMLIVILLGDGPLRFNDLKRQTDGITQRMLSRALKSLERDGLVSRHVTPSVPPRVDYALTPLGVSLWSVIKALGKWAGENHSKIAISRSNYDADQVNASGPE